MWLDWLVFHDGGFQSVCPLMDNDKRLMEASWWERLTQGKPGLVLMGGAMLSKSLIQFSVDGWGCVPSLLFDLRPNYGGVNEDNGDLPQNVLCMHFHTQCPWPCSKPLPTHASARDSRTLQASLGQSLVGPLLLPPGSWCAQHSVCSLQESPFPVLCKFWRLCGWVNGDLLQEGLCHTQVCCTQSPAPAAGHCWPIPLQGTLKHSSVSVSVGSLGPGVHKVCLNPKSISGEYRV